MLLLGVRDGGAAADGGDYTTTTDAHVKTAKRQSDGQMRRRHSAGCRKFWKKMYPKVFSLA